MTYRDWITRFPIPEFFIRDSAPIIAANIKADPLDFVEKRLQQIHANVKARGVT